MQAINIFTCTVLVATALSQNNQTNPDGSQQTTSTETNTNNFKLTLIYDVYEN